MSKKDFLRWNALLKKVSEKKLLRDRQKALEQEYQAWEQVQTEHSENETIYKFCQHRMQALDEEAEEIRRILESEGCL